MQLAQGSRTKSMRVATIALALVAFMHSLAAAQARRSSTSSAAQATAGEDSAVEIVTQRSFESLVGQSAEPWMLEFYAPWCGHCQRMEPMYEATARAVKGDVRVGKVDGPENVALMLRFGVSGFPSIYSVRDKKTYVYTGQRTQIALERFALDPAKHGEAMSTFSDPFGPVGRAKGALFGIGVRVLDVHDHLQREFKLSNSLAWFVVVFLGIIATVTVFSALLFFSGSGAPAQPLGPAPQRPHED